MSGWHCEQCAACRHWQNGRCAEGWLTMSGKCPRFDDKFTKDKPAPDEPGQAFLFEGEE